MDIISYASWQIGFNCCNTQSSGNCSSQSQGNCQTAGNCQALAACQGSCA